MKLYLSLLSLWLIVMLWPVIGAYFSVAGALVFLACPWLLAVLVLNKVY